MQADNVLVKLQQALSLLHEVRLANIPELAALNHMLQPLENLYEEEYNIDNLKLNLALLQLKDLSLVSVTDTIKIFDKCSTLLAACQHNLSESSKRTIVEITKIMTKYRKRLGQYLEQDLKHHNITSEFVSRVTELIERLKASVA